MKHMLNILKNFSTLATELSKESGEMKLELLAEFARTSVDLSNEWYRLDKELGDAMLHDSYPFSKSFEEVVPEIDKWWLANLKLREEVGATLLQDAYPFDKPLDTIAVEIEIWTTNLTRQVAHARFNGKLYCMSKANNEYKQIEDFWFFEIKNYDDETRISNDHDRVMYYVIDPVTFDDNFIQVEKELFELYQKASNAGDTELIDSLINLAVDIGGLIE